MHTEKKNLPVAVNAEKTLSSVNYFGRNEKTFSGHGMRAYMSVINHIDAGLIGGSQTGRALRDFLTVQKS